MSTISPQEYISENEGVIDVDEDTLGSRGKHKGNIISTTKVKIKCQNCLDSVWTVTVNNHDRRNTDVPYCLSCKNRLGISGMKGQSHSKETREKLGVYGDDNPAKQDDVRQKISDALTGRDAEWLKGNSRPEHSRKMSDLMQRVWNESGFRDGYKRKLIKQANKKHSKLHDCVSDWIKREGFVGFESEQVIEESDHGITVDELHRDKELVVEVYGDYWHANPNIYSEDDVLNYPGESEAIASDIRKKDLRRNSFLRDLGYDVVVVWESEFQDDKQGIKKKIAKRYE